LSFPFLLAHGFLSPEKSGRVPRILEMGVSMSIIF